MVRQKVISHELYFDILYWKCLKLHLLCFLYLCILMYKYHNLIIPTKFPELIHFHFHIHISWFNYGFGNKLLDTFHLYLRRNYSLFHVFYYEATVKLGIFKFWIRIQTRVNISEDFSMPIFINFKNFYLYIVQEFDIQQLTRTYRR